MHTLAMRSPSYPSRLVTALAAGSLVLGQMAPVQADTVTATAEAQATPEAAPAGSADLPSRVGRLARLSGTVSFHTADEDHWDPATQNYPVTSGDAFWTEPQASASIEVAGSHIDMAGSTEFDVEQLDDHTLTATQAQGETFLDVRDMQPGETVTVRTPRGSVVIGTDGQYEVAAGDTQTPTTITVVAGAAQVSGDSLALSVAAGQAATVTGSGAATDAFHGSVAAAQRDDFLTAELAAPPIAPLPAAPLAAEPVPGVTAQASVTARVQPPERAVARATAQVSVDAPEVVRQMSGGADLSSYGDWQDSGEYGQVWYPRVQQDWVPYRDGHWAYVAPWGWTWIDDAAWGFAPFHYGRWVQVADRWGWAPVYGAPGFVRPAFYRPVYAPALVGFFGFGAGLAAGLAIGGGVGFGFGLGFGCFGYGHIGWCPLGWGEPYRPWFGGAGYFDRVNRFDVANVRGIAYHNSMHDVTINSFANAARGATVVPTAAMLHSQRAASVAEPFSRGQFADAHPVSTTPRPIAATAGVTPHLAARLGLPAAAAAAAVAHGVPGPHIAADPRGGLALRTPGQTAAAHVEAAVAHTGAAAHAANAAARTGAEAYVADAATRAGAAHAALPALRTAGSFARAAGGAPGPAFTPRAGVQAAPALRQAGAAASPAAARLAGRTTTGATLPSLRSHTAGPVASSGQAPRAATVHQPADVSRFGAAQHFQQAPHVQAPQSHVQTQHYQAPQSHIQTQHYQAPQSHFQTQHYQAPQSHFEAPHYQAPQQHFEAPHYQAPQSHFEAPHYQAPQQHFEAPHYPAPQQHFEAPHYQAPSRPFVAPRPAPAPGTKRPWPP